MAGNDKDVSSSSASASALAAADKERESVQEPPSASETKPEEHVGTSGEESTTTTQPQPQPPEPETMAVQPAEVDDFGLPLRKFSVVYESEADAHDGDESTKKPALRSRTHSRTSSRGGGTNGTLHRRQSSKASSISRKNVNEVADESSSSGSDEDDFKDAESGPVPSEQPSPKPNAHAVETVAEEEDAQKTPLPPLETQAETAAETDAEAKHEAATKKDDAPQPEKKVDRIGAGTVRPVKSMLLSTEEYLAANPPKEVKKPKARRKSPAVVPEKKKEEIQPETLKPSPEVNRDTTLASNAGTNAVVSEFSHQQLTTKKEEAEDEDGGWQTMPAYAPYDIYDDDNRLIAKEHDEAEEEKYSYAGTGGAGKGYTRVLIDDDAESATSMDDNTSYLFKEKAGTGMTEDDDETRDAVSQMQATKDLLTEGQRIAYVGLTRIELSEMVKAAEKTEFTRTTKKAVQLSTEATKMWSQKMMIRLYAHMDISSAEQVMIEQLSEHGVISADLTPLLMANARVKNPMAETDSKSGSVTSSRPGSLASPRPSVSSPRSISTFGEEPAEPPPVYDKHEGEELPAVRTPSQLPTSDKLDIDLRWTILCDLFLLLVADSIYDSRSRVLLERVAKALEISWIEICRFEKKVTEALEMQQQAERENWNEDEHKENRRKMDLKRRYVMMGLATVGGGLVIGLSAGLLAPVIGAGLAAGFTTIGVAGTSSFLAGAGGAAIITSGAAVSGSVIGGRAANRRTGAVKTFEYRPLHNNKRVNLIVTVSGWMTGKVDDVRLPYSTVDPVMGDIYSVLWEPEMLTSMGDTINILATEALTQGLQQVLGSTILMGLMAALQLPVVLTKLSYLIDNPWAVSLDRAWSAGQIMADSLIERNLGTRPITLVGYSLGSRVIFSCLLELARKGAFGLIQNVYMFGSPMVVKQDEYLKIRTVVSGRFVNGYNRNDWILGYLFRLTNGGVRRIAGLAPIEGIAGIENMDVTEFVVGHMDYRTNMPRLLRECGWLVESDEFTEIEDPDPDNHAQRQRELISEIEEARRELEKEGAAKETAAANSNRKSGAFGGFFSRKKKAQKAEWEVYGDETHVSKGHAASGSGAGTFTPTRTEDGERNHGVLFDVEAIRAELAIEQANEQMELQVRELPSTLPPMKITSPTMSPRGSLKETRSLDTSTFGTTLDYRVSGDRTPTYGHSPGGKGGFEDDDNVEMSFDTSYQNDLQNSHHNDQRSQSQSGGWSLHSETSLEAPSRPYLKSAQTVPNITLADPWAQADDEDEYGKEKEIEMTFA